jgi:16S rRNA (guanine1207-N2)-methyltransferase
MEPDLLALNTRSAALLLELLPTPNVPVFVSDAEWPVRPKPHLGLWQRRGVATDMSVWQREYAGALLGLPRSRDELLMHVHLVAARLRPEAPLVLFGLKNAGIMAAEKTLGTIFAEVTTALTKHHGRVFIARHPKQVGVQAAISAWRTQNSVSLGAATVALAAYPGMFAGGTLDPATALLIEQLSGLAAPKTVLDYACGTGIIGLAALQHWPQARLDCVDHDALALLAAAENVPQAGAFVQAEDLSACAGRYDLILSNPPIHHGKRQDYAVVEKLVTTAPHYLARQGVLLLVTQQTVPVQHWSQHATVLVQAEGFRVWRVTNS